MAYERVQKYFDELRMGDKVIVHAAPCDTVPHAAANFGCEEARIAKTMSFLVDEQPIVIVSAGDAKVKNNKYKAFFHKKAKMIPWDYVENYIGHAPGGVCPFEIKEGVDTYLDVSLKRFETVYPAAGSDNSAVALSIEELEKYSNSKEWIDICKNWDV